MENRDAIERWRMGLGDNERIKLNHPTAVWRRFQKDMEDTGVEREPRRNAKDEEIVRLQHENDELRQQLADVQG